MKEIRRIIKEYKEAITEPGMSDYHKEQAKIHAFDEILKLYSECPESESEDAREAMRDAVTASKYLGDDEDTIAGRWHS